MAIKSHSQCFISPHSFSLFSLSVSFTFSVTYSLSFFQFTFILSSPSNYLPCTLCHIHLSSLSFSLSLLFHSLYLFLLSTVSTAPSLFASPSIMSSSLSSLFLFPLSFSLFILFKYLFLFLRLQLISIFSHTLIISSSLFSLSLSPSLGLISSSRFILFTYISLHSPLYFLFISLSPFIFSASLFPFYLLAFSHFSFQKANDLIIGSGTISPEFVDSVASTSYAWTSVESCTLLPCSNGQRHQRKTGD